MDFVLYFMGLIAVAVLTGGLTRMYYQQMRRRDEPQQWYWWVGYDPLLKKEFILAVVGKNATEAQSKLGDKNYTLSMNARLYGGHLPDKPGRHILVARSLSEINVEGT